MPHSGIAESAISAVLAREQAQFLATRPRSLALAQRAQACLLGGVPMHWMADWSTPCPLFVDHAQGAHFVDVDGHTYVDFCLGDTGAMYGHAPPAIAQALQAQASLGLTTMLPGEDAVRAGELLAARFGLPYWQMTATATDANRSALRWVRALSGLPVVVVFDGCYHGTTDDTLVRWRHGRTVHRAGLVGQVHDLTRSTRAIPFNDVAALEAALAPGDVAAVLLEPAMTNIGMVLPDPGFLDTVRQLTRAHGVRMIVDETHTLSTGPGGCTRAWGLQPDLLTVGKAIAGGVPCAVWGCSAEVASAIQHHRTHTAEPVATDLSTQNQGHGHSGMGTTLSANALAMRALRTCLEAVATEAAHAHMQALAQRLALGLRALFAQHRLAWSVTELGARCEFQFCATPPRTGAAAEAAFHDRLQQVLHLGLLNRGVLLTPFHNMMLCSPATTVADVDQLLTQLDAVLCELLDQPGARSLGASA